MHTLCWRARYAGSTTQAEGLDFKQSVADAIAGEYDREAITAEVQAAASASPLVLFTWESSPACKKALKLLAETGTLPVYHPSPSPSPNPSP